MTFDRKADAGVGGFKNNNSGRLCGLEKTQQMRPLSYKSIVSIRNGCDTAQVNTVEIIT